MSEISSEFSHAISFFKKDRNKTLELLKAQIKENPQEFRKSLSKAIEASLLRFDEVSSIALGFSQIGRSDISVAVYRMLISEEESLERRIEGEDNAGLRKELEAFKEKMAFSLGRDYNDLGIAYINIEDKDNAKKMILRAYNEDVKHQKEHRAALMPAYRNLSLVLVLEATIFYDRGEYFSSFLLAWVSLELSLMRIWFKIIVDKEYSNKKLKWLGRLDIGVIIESIYLLGKLEKEEKNDIDNMRGVRNALIHATGETPTAGSARRIIELAQRLHSKA